MTRTTSGLAPPSPNFHTTPTGGRLTTTYGLAYNGPHTRRICSEIVFGTWSLRPQSRDPTTRPPRPSMTLVKWQGLQKHAHLHYLENSLSQHFLFNNPILSNLRNWF
ncbi:hypothetical protein AVEN_65602-1 [Araneus ventricosus]|uniref:Uncharacterized protein n=1 Tax=Araneus ventricosus TaxID=182803 RepID=A0A4Y2P1K0_ARAVE|nr:hypothetical protein AVEN_65602-1 [Araneus ventricosus]